MIGDGILVCIGWVVVTFNLLVVVGFANALLICPWLGYTMLIARVVVAASCLRLSRVWTACLAGRGLRCGLGWSSVRDEATLSAILLMMLRCEGYCSEEGESVDGGEAGRSTVIQLEMSRMNINDKGS